MKSDVAVLTSLLASLFLGIAFSLPLRSLEGAPVAKEEGETLYTLGLSYLERGEEKKAESYFRRALQEGGSWGDLARVEIIRFTARKGGEGVKEEILSQLNQVENPSMVSEAWFAAVQALQEAEQEELALELALELSTRFPRSEKADDALFFAAEFHFKQGAPASALETLFLLLERYQESDSLDDAYYLLGRIYLTPGPFYSKARALAAFHYFQNHLGEEPFASSLWKEEVISILKEYSSWYERAPFSGRSGNILEIQGVYFVVSQKERISDLC